MAHVGALGWEGETPRGSGESLSVHLDLTEIQTDLSHIKDFAARTPEACNAIPWSSVLCMSWLVTTRSLCFSMLFRRGEDN